MKKLFLGLLVALFSLSSTAQNNCNADFQYTLGLCPTVLFFSDFSNPNTPDAYTLWEFGDGTVSDDPSPEHFYGANGEYEVCLTVEANGCTSTQCQVIVIDCHVDPPVCESYFQYSDSDCPTIEFFGATTTPPPGDDQGWYWEFGDGTSATGPNPTHTYSANGVYEVCLVTYNSTGCAATYCDEVVIECVPPNCETYFEYSHGFVCGLVSFWAADIGSADAQYTWHFGDGTTSEGPQVVHTFEDGIYTICMVVTYSNGCVAEYCEEIIIDCNTPCELWFLYTDSCPDVQFSAFSNSANPPGTFDYVWDFGDGSTGVGSEVNHTYTSNGIYHVCLTSVCENGVQVEYCEEININCVPPACISHFEYENNCPEVEFFASLSASGQLAEHYLWDFGDGNQGEGWNPTHTYTENGTYLVCLWVTCEDGTVEYYSEHITITCLFPCEAYFEYSDDNCPTVEFWAANANVPPVDPIIWTWYFSDGTTATGPHVVHTFDGNGIYDVCLVVTTPDGCTDEYCEEIIIECEPQPCHAFFDYQLECAFAQFYVILPPDVVPGAEHIWDFGDGHTGYGWEPAHTYQENGVYKVCLTVICQDGSIEEFCLDIIIDCYPPCLALFAYETECRTAEFYVALPSGGSPNSGYIWDFGDGTTGEGLNPVHVYEADGVYEVCLTVICDNGSVEQFCDVVIIECEPPQCQANFEYSTEDCPTVEFFAINSTTPANGVNWYWDFGDGNTGTGPNPEHTYCSNGTYTVCLIVITEDGCVAQHCEDIVIDCIPPDCHAYFDYDQSDCPVIHFYSSTTGTTPNNTTQWQWIFGDGTTGYGPNPEHEYEQNGIYTVCLVVTTADGCTAAHCEEIIVDCIPSTCDVFFDYEILDCPAVQFYIALPSGDPNQLAEYIWDFGDGTIGYGVNPFHLYPTGGVYTACLTMITADGCVAEFCEEVVLDCQPVCEAWFEYDDSDCPVIRFFAANDPVPNNEQQWQWDFGDGSVGYGPIVEHEYEENGVYTVCLVRTCDDGISVTYCEEIWVECEPGYCDAFFEYSQEQCPEVQFYSVHPEPSGAADFEWIWEFGDGHTGYGPSPTHVYAENGIYTVCLTMICDNGDASTYCEEIWIDCLPPPCEAYFQYTLGDCPTVHFYSSFNMPPTGANDYWHWDFGDGTTGYGPEPVHTYEENGIYVVCLTITTPDGCTSTYCEEIWIDCTPGCEAFFEFNRDECPTVEFFAGFNTPSGNGEYHWDFGDGTAGSGPNPVHTYAENGMYEVCLTIVTPWGCAATYCDVVRITCLRTGFVKDFLSTVSAYPNPSADRVMIELEDDYDEVFYTLSGMDGHEYDRRLLDDQSSFEVDLTGLINGIYFLKIEAGENSGTVKLFKY